MLACQICHILWCWIFRTGRHPALKLRIVCRNMDNNCPYCILVAWGHVETLCPHLLHACWEQNASQPLRSSLWVFGVPKGVPALHQKDREKHGCWEHHGGQLRTMRRFVIKDHGKICRVFLVHRIIGAKNSSLLKGKHPYVSLDVFIYIHVSYIYWNLLFRTRLSTHGNWRSIYHQYRLA